jgi:1-acyl-sn-glycerol-3-phosphate acyltransferase
VTKRNRPKRGGEPTATRDIKPGPRDGESTAADKRRKASATTTAASPKLDKLPAGVAASDPRDAASAPGPVTKAPARPRRSEGKPPSAPKTTEEVAPELTQLAGDQARDQVRDQVRRQADEQASADEALAPPSAPTVAPPARLPRGVAGESSRGQATPTNGAAVLSDVAALHGTADTHEHPASVRSINGAGPENGFAALHLSAQAPDEEIWTEEAASGVTDIDPSSQAALREDDGELTSRLARGSSGDRTRDAAAFGSSQSLLSTDYYFRQYGARGLRTMAAEVDDFGFDPHVDAKARPLLEALCKRYFRVELIGAENVPEHGRALLVANRSGALPWDGLVLRTCLRSARPELSPLRWLSEDSVIQYPFMGVLMNRLGAVRACPENAERLLEQDRLVAVFPEGAQGSRKLFRDRYRLQRFGRGGYVKLALKLGVPILPTAIIGAEETNPVLRRSRVLGRMFGSESLPITPTFPWLGVAGLLPAPVRWRIVIGAPLDLSQFGAQSADDALIVHRLNEQIRSSLQGLVDQEKTQRGGIFFG